MIKIKLNIKYKNQIKIIKFKVKFKLNYENKKYYYRRLDVEITEDLPKTFKPGRQRQ